METRKKNNLNYQIKKSLIYKVIAIAASFLVVKFYLKYLGVDDYGLWAILINIMSFVTFFDFGISNGIKNHVTSAIDDDNKYLAKCYISTAYICVAIVSVIIFIIAVFIVKNIDLDVIYNSRISEFELEKITIAMFLFVLVNLIITTANNLYFIKGESQLLSLSQLYMQISSLCIMIILSFFTKGNVFFCVIQYGVSLVLTNLFVSIFFYRKHSEITPSFLCFDKKLINVIFSSGGKFFCLQILFFILQAKDRILIGYLIDNPSVAYYDLLYKYFSLILIVHTIINNPLWPLYTSAFKRNDYKWFESIKKKLLYLVVFYIIIGVVMIFTAQSFFYLWVGDEITISYKTSAYMMCMIISLIIFSIFAFFSNGINKTKIQFISVIIGCVINFPLAYFLVKDMNMGINGVLLSTTISLSVFCFSGFIQFISEIDKIKRLSNVKIYS